MTRLGKTLCLVFLFVLTVAMSVSGQAKIGATAKGTSAASASATVPSAGAKVESAPTLAEAKPAAPEAGATSAPPASPPIAAAPSSASPSGMDGSTYQVRLRDLEQKIDELKEQIRRSHTRLSLLSETILSGGTGGARAEITFVNDMSSAFRMTQALFVLDGAVQYNKQDETGVLAGQREIPIFSGSIPPGDHTLQVLVKLRGHGYGVFSYLQGYRFEIRSSHSFTVTEGKTIELKAIAFEKGDVTTPIEQRPAVRYHKNLKTGLQSGTVAPATATKPTVGGSQSFSVTTGRQ
ncbi:MAG TPA: hypothetical protein VIV60_34075 [Polyangiaceae bacterium]